MLEGSVDLLDLNSGSATWITKRRCLGSLAAILPTADRRAGRKTRPLIIRPSTRTECEMKLLGGNVLSFGHSQKPPPLRSDACVPFPITAYGGARAARVCAARDGGARLSRVEAGKRTVSDCSKRLHDLNYTDNP